LAADKPDANLLVVEGKVLALASADLTEQAAAYKNPNLPLAPALIRSVVMDPGSAIQPRIVTCLAT
jgi:hypothetical protein